MPVQDGRSRKTLSVVLLTAAHIAVTVPLAYYLNIWSDEASSLHTTESVTYALANAATFERQAPLYFWLLSLWRELDPSIFFARLPSIAASACAIWVFAAVCRQLLSDRAALAATSFFALHPVLVWASVEVRVYAFVILISVGLVQLYLRVFVNDDRTPGERRWGRVWFTVLAIAALYTNYYLGFLLVGLLGGLIVTRRLRAAREYMVLMLIAAAAFAPLLITFRSQFEENVASFNDERTLLIGLRQIWASVLTYLLPADMGVVKESAVSILRLWIMRLVLLALGLILIRRYRQLSSLTLAFGAATGVVLAALLMAYFALGSEFVLVRHATVLFVPLIVTAACLLNDLSDGERLFSRLQTRTIATAAAILVMAFFSYGLITLYPNMAKPGDWARVGEYVEQNERQDQPIIVFHTYDAMTLPYHYRGVNKVLPDERYLDFESGLATPEQVQERTDFTISKIPPDAAEIWLLENNECEISSVCEPMDDFIQQNFTVESEHEFYLQKVRLLRRKGIPRTASR